MMAEDQQQWKILLSSNAQKQIEDLDSATSLQSFHRKAWGKLVRNEMDARTFFLISCLSWMEYCKWFENDPAIGKGSVNLQSVVSFISRTGCMASWMIPHVTDVPNLARVFEPRKAWISFWMKFYDKCNETVEGGPPKAKKMRLASSFNNTSQDSKHGLPCTYLMVALLHARSNPETWDQLHDLALSSSKCFKYVKEYVNAALMLYGLHCIHSNTRITGLNPLLLFQKYIGTFG